MSRCLLGDELPQTSHVDHKGRLKIVRYWAMSPVGGVAEPRNEVDAVRWVGLAEAAGVLTYEADQTLLRTFSAIVTGRGAR